METVGSSETLVNASTIRRKNPERERLNKIFANIIYAADNTNQAQRNVNIRPLKLFSYQHTSCF